MIDAEGHVHDATRLFHNTVVTTTVTTTTGETPYVRFGDWVVAGSAALLLVFAAWSRRRGAAVVRELSETTGEPVREQVPPPVREPVGT